MDTWDKDKRGVILSKGRRKLKGDVLWYIPKKKKPIAYSSKAASDLIVLLAEETNGTIKEVYEQINYDQEAKKVLKAYTDNGFGNIVAKEWFR